jgi:hypothetical protein
MNKKYLVNVLTNDNPHKQAKSKSLKSFGKGKARITSNKATGLSLLKLTNILEDKYSFLSNPVKNVNQFTKEFWNAVFTSKDKNKINNSFLALIFKAINSKKYGSNKKATIKAKGFDRKLIDTGQTMKSLKIKVGNGKAG